MFSGPLNLFAAHEHIGAMRRSAARTRDTDDGRTPVTRVTLRQATADDGARLRALAELDSAPAPVGPTLVAEIDGRLRAALPLDGTNPIADPFHRGAELIELLRIRAAQLAQTQPAA